MKIRINDKVQIMKGKDQGKSGKVIQVFAGMNKIVVEGVNTMYKHIRSNKRGEKGQRVEFNGPIAISNVALICPKCGRASRLGYKLLEEGKQKARMCKKCKEVID